MDNLSILVGRTALRRRTLLLALTLGLVPAVTLRAGDHAWSLQDVAPETSDRRPDSVFSQAYGALLWSDTERLFTAPLRWDRQDWLLAGGLVGVVAGSSVFDGQIREESQEHRSVPLDDFTRTAQRLGGVESFAVLGLFEGYGRLTGDGRARAVAMDGLTASLLAGGVVTPALKLLAGRARPYASDRVYDFRPFSGDLSFPSGHTTQAFALASVISAHYRRWWVDGLCYGLAGVVGYSRIQQNAHFASDVVAGAIIGTVVGRSVVRWHGPVDPDRWSCAPWSADGTTGLLLSRSF